MNSYAAKLPKWFGERPGKRAGDPETPEGEEDAKVGAEEEEIEEEEVEEKPVSFFFEFVTYFFKF